MLHHWGKHTARSTVVRVFEHPVRSRAVIKDFLLEILPCYPIQLLHFYLLLSFVVKIFLSLHTIADELFQRIFIELRISENILMGIFLPVVLVNTELFRLLMSFYLMNISLFCQLLHICNDNWPSFVCKWLFLVSSIWNFCKLYDKRDMWELLLAFEVGENF